MTDMRFLVRPSGETVLQFRVGKPETVGNTKYDKYSDRADTGKYTTKINWGKWKDVRTESQLIMPKIRVLEQE